MKFIEMLGPVRDRPAVRVQGHASALRRKGARDSGGARGSTRRRLRRHQSLVGNASGNARNGHVLRNATVGLGRRAGCSASAGSTAAAGSAVGCSATVVMASQGAASQPSDGGYEYVLQIGTDLGSLRTWRDRHAATRRRWRQECGHEPKPVPQASAKLPAVSTEPAKRKGPRPDPEKHLMNPKLLPLGRLRYMRNRQYPMREGGWATAPPPKPRALSREMPPDKPWQCYGLLCTAAPNAPTDERCSGCGRDPDGFDRDGYDNHGYDRDGFDLDGEPRPLAERLAMAQEANRRREQARAKAPPPEPTAMALDNWNAGRKQVLSACPDCSWVGQSTRGEARCPMCSKVS